jgi:predicted enzyme related to lactoylglutathione lyase
MLTPLKLAPENINPILRVEDMKRSLAFYVEILGFKNADWGNDDFTYVMAGNIGIYLCRGGQGRGAAWIWMGVDDAEKLHEELKQRGVKIVMPPRNSPGPWRSTWKTRTATSSAWARSPNQKPSRVAGSMKIAGRSPRST